MRVDAVREGANAGQVHRSLGHHSPAFTLTTYVHLLPDELGEPLSLSAELVGNTWATEGTELEQSPAIAELAFARNKLMQGP